MMFIVFFFLYSRKRKSGAYDMEDVDAASDLSEKDRMLREKEAEVLYWFEIISFYSLPRKPWRIKIPHKTIITTTMRMQECPQYTFYRSHARKGCFYSNEITVIDTLVCN